MNLHVRRDASTCLRTVACACGSQVGQWPINPVDSACWEVVDVYYYDDNNNNNYYLIV